MDERILNRELSWLDFNERVLAQAAEPGVPLLERVKFLAICSNNLDEFFQVRVAALKDQVAAGITMPSPDGRLPAQQLLEIMDRVHRLVDAQEALLLHELMPALAESGIAICSWDELDLDDQKQLVEVFEQRIFPVLTPLAVDPGHPFPYISNLSLNLGVMVSEPGEPDRRFARVKVPPLLPRFLPIGAGDRLIAIEQVIASQLGSLFPGMHLEDHLFFRVTRNADLTLEEEEADDLLAAVELELRRRRFGRAVRIEVQQGVSEHVLKLLLDELDLSHDDVTYHEAALDLSGLFVVHAVDRPDLKDDPWPPVTPRRIAHALDEDLSLFQVIRDGDVLVHHPYESFAGSVEAFIDRAADDPRVQSIKLTLYRTSGDSPIASSLIRAAERGVQVAVMVELKARFDEQANVTWARTLERAGVHVVYGMLGLKTHAKCVLVVREDEDGTLRRYAHAGTGNYNSKTARTYEDLGLLTADPEITADIGELFNHLTGFSNTERYRTLLVAPNHLRGRLLDLVAGEAARGQDGRITAKMNSLTDPDLIEALYAASNAGCEIDLVVRGVCCLRPGVPGMSERITVRSILGRYLEHSRIYRFEHGGEPGPVTLIGSADVMPRNLDRRVEALLPVRDPAHQERLAELLEMNLADDIVAWELGADAVWTRRQGDGLVDVQRRIAEQIAGAPRQRRSGG